MVVFEGDSNAPLAVVDPTSGVVGWRWRRFGAPARLMRQIGRISRGVNSSVVGEDSGWSAG